MSDVGQNDSASPNTNHKPFSVLFSESRVVVRVRELVTVRLNPSSVVQIACRVQTVVATGLLKTPRLLRLLRVARRIDRYSEYGASVLLLLMAAFTLFAHWLACAFYALAFYELPNLDPAIGYLNYLANLTGMEYDANVTTSGPDVRSCYITSLYFTFTILTSVGFGNVAPVTNLEKVFTIFAMMVGCEYRLCGCFEVSRI